MNFFCRFFCLMLIFSQSIYSQVNPINGIATTSVSLLNNIQLRYVGDYSGRINIRNEASPVSWLGLGWKLGSPSIFVMHNNTVDINDDRWFFNDGYGNAVEIVRVFESGTEKFYLKNSPFSRVTPHYSTSVGLISIIDGWEIISPDGTTSRFGDRGNIPMSLDTSANRYLPCFGNVIGTGMSGVSSPRKFYYQWDLKEVEDVNHNKTTYTNSQFSRTTNTGYCYTGQSYLKSITNAIGDRTEFTLGDKYADATVNTLNEGFLEKAEQDFNYNETKYLSQITFKNANGETIADATFKYSGDSGERNHLNSAVRGFAKRLLTKIQSTTNPLLNYNFAYTDSTVQLPYKGLLSSVSTPASGRQDSYDYTEKIMLGEDIFGCQKIETSLPAMPTDSFLKSNPVVIGDHIFCFTGIRDNMGQNTATTRCEIFDRVSTLWSHAQIDGVTSANLSNTAIYPALNRFVVVSKTSPTAITQSVKIYEWIDDRWIKTFQRTDFPSINIFKAKFDVIQGSNYFVLLDKTISLIYVYRKINNEWQSTFNAPAVGSPATNTNIATACNTDSYGAGWHWPVSALNSTDWTDLLNSQIVPGNDFFLYTHPDRFIDENGNKSGIYTVAHMFYWNGTTWELQKVPDKIGTADCMTFFSSSHCNRGYGVINGFDYECSDVFGTNSFYPQIEIRENRYFMFNPGGGEFCIRKYDPANKYWAPEFLEGRSMNSSMQNMSFGNSPVAKVGIGLDYVAWLHNHNQLLLYKLNQNNAWVQTYIAPTNTVDPKSGSIAKNFNLSIDGLICGTNSFLAVAWKGIAREQVWCFRWDGLQAKWRSALNGISIEVDECGQGTEVKSYREPNEVHFNDYFINRDHLTAVYRDFVLINGSNVATQIVETMKYDYHAGSFIQTGMNDAITAGGYIYPNSVMTPKEKVIVNDNYFVRLQYESDGITGVQGLSCISRTHDNWAEVVRKPLVSTYTRSGNYANKSVAQYYKYYSWFHDHMRYDPLSEIVFFANVETWQNATSPTPKIATYFNIDSSSGLFGTVREVQTLSSAGQLVGKSKNTWYTYQADVQHRRFSLPLILRSESTQDNVTTKTIFPFEYYRLDFNAGDGQPGVSYNVNSDGKYLLKFNRQACTQTGYEGMQPLNMRTQVASNEIYQVTPLINFSFNSNSSLGTGDQSISLGFTGDYSELSAGDKLSINLNVSHSLLSNNFWNILGVNFFNVSLRYTLTNGSVNTIPLGAIGLPLFVPSTIHYSYSFGSDASSIASMELLLGGLDYATEIGMQTEVNQNLLSPTNCIAASVNTWKVDRGVFSPFQKFVWNVSKDNTGKPTTEYSPFDFSNISTNINWALQGTNSLFNEKEQVVEAINASQVYSNTIINAKNFLTTGTILNATLYESAVFTCDYDQNNGIYFDYSNGWEHGIGNSANSSPSTSAIDAMVKHFGDATVHVVNAFGPTRNVKIEKDNAGNIKNYELSAWVKPAAGVNLQKNVVIGIDYRRQIGTGWPVNLVPATTQAPIACSGTLTVKGSGPWYFISLTVPASTDLANQTWNPGWYARLWVGVPNGGEMWIDDIRFAPKNAMVTSTYYDAKWRQPLLSVDANNNPSQQITYDGFGRPIEWRKIDKSNPAVTQLVSKKEYHLMGE